MITLKTKILINNHKMTNFIKYKVKNPMYLTATILNLILKDHKQDIFIIIPNPNPKNSKMAKKPTIIKLKEIF